MENQTLEQAKEQFNQEVKSKHGTTCPCCERFAKVYKRKLNSTMVRCLIKLSKLKEGYHHVSKIVEGISNTGTNDFSKLKYWGFIEDMVNLDQSKKTSGFWKITDEGKFFVNSPEVAVAYKYALVYNGECLKLEGSTTIIEALGDNFNYKELMQS